MKIWPMRSLSPVLLIIALSLTLSFCGDSSDSDKKPVNEICDGNSDCASGICYRSVCASSTPGANGASCTGQGECKSFVCQGGICAGGSLTGGSSCRYNEECRSGVCSQGKCTFISIDGGGPDASPPDAGVPDGPPLDGPLPDHAVPDKATPDKATPDMAIPDMAIPDMAVPDKAIPDKMLPDKGCTGCTILFKCIAKGAVNPQDSCFHCDPTKSTTAWTRFAGKGCVTTIAGDKWGYLDGDAAKAKFSWTAGLLLEGNKLYIATHGGATELYTRIRVLDLSTMKVSTLAGQGNAAYADGAALTKAKLKQPIGMVMDSSGILYVADFGNNRIRAIKGGLVATLAGDGTLGTKDGAFFSAQLSKPYGLAMDSAGDLYVTTRMANGKNTSVRKLDMKTSKVSTVYNYGSIYQDFTGIGLDGKGKAYVNHYDVYHAGFRGIRTLDLATKALTKFAGGQAGCTTGALASAKFKKGSDLKISSNGTIYVADKECWQLKVISGGKVTAVPSTSQYGKVDGNLSTTKLGHVTSIAVDDKTGKVYFADMGNYKAWSRIRVYTP